MREVAFYSKALDKEFKVGRVIGEAHGNEDGPVLVFFGGVHGNEPAGVIALMRVFEKLKQMDLPLRGSIYAYSGNMAALEGRFTVAQDPGLRSELQRMSTALSSISSGSLLRG